MGDNMKGIDMGKKYEFKPDTNPAPGQYNIESGVSMTKERKYEAKIVPYDEKAYKRPPEASPEPGQYQSKTITFGDGLKNVDMGRKYEFKVDSNPVPGQFNTESSVVKTKSVAATIR